MAVTLNLSYDPTGGEPDPALSIVLGDDGRVEMRPRGEHAQKALDLIGGGVFSAKEGRFVAPEEGLPFVLAVQEMLGRSSVWRLSAEQSG